MEDNYNISSHSISNNDDTGEKNDTSSNNKGEDTSDSPAFRLRPRRSTPRSHPSSSKKATSGSLIFSRLRSQQQTPATRTASSAKRNLFAISEPNGVDGKESTINDCDSGDIDNNNTRTDFKRDVRDSITTDVLISPFMQRISVVDLKPNSKYEHNYITLQVKEVITPDNSSEKPSSRAETQDKNTSPSSTLIKTQQTATRGPDTSSTNREETSDGNHASDESSTCLLRLICIEPKYLCETSFSDDGDMSVGSNDTIASNSSTTRRTSTRKKRRVSALLSPYESPEPYLSREKLLAIANPMPMVVELHGEYAKCSIKVGKLINIAKFKTVMTSDSDIKSLRSHDELTVNSAKVKTEDTPLSSPKNIIITYKGSTYTCLPFHVEIKAEIDSDDTGSTQLDIENFKFKDSSNNRTLYSWVPFVSITTFVDKPTDPLVEISSTSQDKKNTDRELQQQKESSNHSRSQNGSNLTPHNELSQGESSDASTDESRHKKFFYNTHNTLKQASESPDMKILLKPSSSH